jgi:MFS transporter, FSR family, fosmidomycin resistance protein
MTQALNPSTVSFPTLRQDAVLIALVSIAHSISHFSQLVLAPLFPWLKEAFSVSYTELGLVLSVFFVVSCAVQAGSGFLVDRYGPRPVLFAGLSCLIVALFLDALAPAYWVLLVAAVLAGMGNGVFHPVDYTLFNRRVAPHRLGHAYSAHGISGSLGWALAAAMMVPMAMLFSWRWAFVSAAVLAAAVLVLLVVYREVLVLSPGSGSGSKKSDEMDPGFGFLRIPAVWMCFGFFFFYSVVLSVIQAFAPEAARHLHEVPLRWVAACLTIYMVASAGGMVLGGFLASNPDRCERIVAFGIGIAAVVALNLALSPVPGDWVPVMFGLMGFASGIASPSRDLLVKKSTPENATGRVYGVVYAGLDIGQAVAPVFFGRLMDQGEYTLVLLGLAAVQSMLIVSAFNVRRVRRTA